MLKESHIFYL